MPYSSSIGMTSSCAAIWKTESADVYTIGLAGAHVLVAELLDDDGTARRPVAEPAQPGLARERVHDLGRKAVRVRRERLVEAHPDHLPVPGRGVLAGRELGAAAPRRSGVLAWSDPFDARDVAEPHGAEVGHLQAPNCARGVAERVAADIAVVRGIGKLTHTDRVEHENDRTRRGPVAHGSASRCGPADGQWSWSCARGATQRASAIMPDADVAPAQECGRTRRHASGRRRAFARHSAGHDRGDMRGRRRWSALTARTVRAGAILRVSAARAGDDEAKDRVSDLTRRRLRQQRGRTTFAGEPAFSGASTRVVLHLFAPAGLYVAVAVHASGIGDSAARLEPGCRKSLRILCGAEMRRSICQPTRAGAAAMSDEGRPGGSTRRAPRAKVEPQGRHLEAQG